jgi:hypothetical protein
MNTEFKNILQEEENEAVAVKSVPAEGASNRQTDMKMVLLNSSLQHAYTQMEFDDTKCLMTREFLTVRMESLREAYFHARESLWNQDPDVVIALEKDLNAQKQEFFKPKFHA